MKWKVYIKARPVSIILLHLPTCHIKTSTTTCSRRLAPRVVLKRDSKQGSRHLVVTTWKKRSICGSMIPRETTHETLNCLPTLLRIAPFRYRDPDSSPRKTQRQIHAWNAYLSARNTYPVLTITFDSSGYHTSQSSSSTMTSLDSLVVFSCGGVLWLKPFLSGGSSSERKLIGLCCVGVL